MPFAQFTLIKHFRHEDRGMTLAQLVDTLEGRLFNLDRLWYDNPHLRLQEESEALCEELQELHPLQASRLAELTDARQTLSRLEIEAAMLASRVEASVFAKESGAAWQKALELDCLRQSLQQERDRVARLEDQANGEAAVIQDLQDRLSLLQEKLYS
jgi:chromosome segregation ATPase